MAALWLHRAIRKAGELPKYLGIFLSPESQQELLQRFPPKHESVRGEHVTLLFAPTEEDVAELEAKGLLGSEADVKVVGYAEDDRGQAVVVDLPEGFRSSNTIPHVTLSVDPDTEAVYSNELLERGYQRIEPFTLRGVVDRAKERPEEGTDGPEASEEDPAEASRRWEEFLRGKTRNPEYGRHGHHQERVLRKTLYDAGGPSRQQVLDEWRSRSRQPAS